MSAAKLYSIAQKAEKKELRGIALENYLSALELLIQSKENVGQFLCLKAIVRLYRMVGAERHAKKYIQKFAEVITIEERDPKLIFNHYERIDPPRYLKNTN